ncbi:MAG: methylenetetrahydrofolate reductase [NAD(P)H] [Actinobacteria bacterium]|nr:methylenetetrahydrofolate reductase [NAD(P)H] [Actinomycetota bacterium]
MRRPFSFDTPNGKPIFSLEFFPPKDEKGEANLWVELAELNSLQPEFVSVTYGAGGSTRERTVRITSEITARTGLRTVAHLTCIGSSKNELSEILDQYWQAGIRDILALRGDPPTGPQSEWIPTAGGFSHSDELVSLAAAANFNVGVAAFPDYHPASNGDHLKDISVLLEKERRGAQFATTQFFFSTDKYYNLVNELKERGSNLPIFAGILPITQVKQLNRMAQLGGTPIPANIVQKFSRIEDDPEKVKALGIEIAVNLCEELIAMGAPGLHFYTMNNAYATKEIVKRIGLR